MAAVTEAKVVSPLSITYSLLSFHFLLNGWLAVTGDQATNIRAS
jgi:hypothetical protein